MSTTDLGIVPSPKPGPVTPNRVPIRGAGVNNDEVEMRSRLMALVLPHAPNALRSLDGVMTAVIWMETGEWIEDES